MPVVVGHEHVRLVRRRGGIVDHVVEGHAIETWRRSMAACRPGGAEHQVLHGDEFHRPICLRLIDQDRRRAEIDVCAVAIDARRGRCGNAEEIRTKVVHAHGSIRHRPAHHVGRFADVGWIANVSVGERNIHVAESLSGGADFGKRGLTRAGRTRRLGFEVVAHAQRIRPAIANPEYALCTLITIPPLVESDSLIFIVAQ